jgi:hypothetical protein
MQRREVDPPAWGLNPPAWEQHLRRPSRRGHGRPSGGRARRRRSGPPTRLQLRPPSHRRRPGSSIGRRSGGLTVATWGLYSDGLLCGGSLSDGDLSLNRCSLLASPSVELEPLQLLPTPCNRQTPLPAPVQQPRGQRGKGRAEPPGERGELRFSAPSRPNRARERVLRQLLAGSCVARAVW